MRIDTLSDETTHWVKKRDGTAEPRPRLWGEDIIIYVGGGVSVCVNLTQIIPAVVGHSDVSGSSWYHGHFTVSKRPS